MKGINEYEAEGWAIIQSDDNEIDILEKLDQEATDR